MKRIVALAFLFLVALPPADMTMSARAEIEEKFK